MPTHSQKRSDNAGRTWYGWFASHTLTSLTDRKRNAVATMPTCALTLSTSGARSTRSLETAPCQRHSSLLTLVERGLAHGV